jgi:hypothetical protein
MILFLRAKVDFAKSKTGKTGLPKPLKSADLEVCATVYDMTFYPVTNVTWFNSNDLRCYTPRYKSAQPRYIWSWCINAP